MQHGGRDVKGDGACGRKVLEHQPGSYGSPAAHIEYPSRPWAEEGVVPRDAVRKIRGARYDMELFRQAMKETHHDMTAFLRSVYPSLGEESRYLHLGLTTSDIWDTALSLQMVEATDLLAKDVDSLLTALEARALEHKDTVMIGRTHGVHAEPITFGLKLALWVD
ncbi:MAG: lyase family protein, partial [Nitrospinota bacterium]